MLYRTRTPGMGGGALEITCSDTALRQIWLNPEGELEAPDKHPLLNETCRQLQAYFNGKLFDFDLPLEMIGTPFQRRCWEALRDIPYGETRSYGQIASVVGDSKAVRAVGAANGRNPIPIVVPCHRVIGANGKLVGFGGGLPMKQLLLRLEANHAGLFRPATA